MPRTDLHESPPLELAGRDLTVDQVVAVARHGFPVALADVARRRMEASRSVIERVVAEGRTVYGVTTGFGDLTDVVRAMLVLRANALAVGLSGARVVVAELLCAMLNARIHPV